MQRAVFLDRDGVINAAVVRGGLPFPPKTAADTVVLPGVESALRQLKALGFLTVVVTNQPDIARGTTNVADVDEINQHLQATLAIDYIQVCPHDGPDNCHCRKPKPGMLTDAAAKWGIDLAASFMVGDRWRDIDCGKSAGVRTFFIDYGYAERQPSGYDWRVSDLSEAATIISKLNLIPESSL